jgi:hypothetical protein
MATIAICPACLLIRDMVMGEKAFLRTAQAMGTVSDTRRNSGSWMDQHYAAYSHGNLYVTCEANFVMRYVLSVLVIFISPIFFLQTIYVR